MSIKRKFTRSLLNDDCLKNVALVGKIFAAVAAMGFVISPLGAEAEIIKASGDRYLGAGQNKADIYADAILKNEVGLNSFKKFEVDAGKIANMYFKQEGSNLWVNNLVNVVGSRIDVNGTVNAVQNNKVGGNLFFMSSDGMVVGKSGVINAGTLNMMTPYNKYFVEAGLAKWTDDTVENVANGAIDILNRLWTDLDPVEMEAFQDLFMMNHWGKIREMEVPINKAGTITVLGKINTINGMQLKASNINVGINPKTSEIGNAVLQSGVTNFKDLVNLGSTKAGLAQDLTAVQDEAGNIELVAFADMNNYYNKDYTNPFAVNAWGDNTTRAEINVGAGSSIEAVGDVSISAEAVNGASQRMLFDPGLYESILANMTVADLLGNVSRTEAIVNVDGKVEAHTFQPNKAASVEGGHVNIDATAENCYVAESFTDPASMAKGLLKSFMPLDSDLSYVNIESLAEVNVGKKADIIGNATTAVGEDEDGNVTGSVLINATSEMEAAGGASAAAVLYTNRRTGRPTNPNSPQNLIGQIIPNAALTSMETDNQARVNIEGDVTSKGGISITAEASGQVEASATADAPVGLENDHNHRPDEGQGNLFNAAVNFAEFVNIAEVNLKSGKQSAAGDLQVEATAEQQATSNAVVGTSEFALGNTAVNITDIDGRATVNVASELEAKNIDIDAHNSIVQEITADNLTGLGSMTARATDRGTSEIQHRLNIVPRRIMKPRNMTVVDKIGQIASVGASINIVEETNTADINIKKNANIQGQGNVEMVAANIMGGSHIASTGSTNNYRKDPNVKIMANGAVNISETNNIAKITVEGSDDKETAPIIKGQNVALHAVSEFRWGRLQKIKDDFDEAMDYIKEAYETDQEVIESAKAAYAAMQNMTTDDTTTLAEFSYRVDDLLEKVNMSNVNANMEAVEAFITLPAMLMEMAQATSYSNFHGAATTGGKVPEAGGTGVQASELAMAGAVMVNDTLTDAQVIIGKNAKIEAEKDLQLLAHGRYEDLVMDAKIKYILPYKSANGANFAAGGQYGQHDAILSSKVIVAEDAELKAENIDLKAENLLKRVLFNYGGGEGVKLGISGMVGNAYGASDSIVLVDDDALLEAQDKITLHSQNDANVISTVGNLSQGKAVGAAVALVDYDVNNIAGVADVHRDPQRTKVLEKQVEECNAKIMEYYEAGNDEERIAWTEKLSAAEDELRLLKVANLGNIGGVQATGDGSGSLKASEVNVAANTVGYLTTASVAGTLPKNKKKSVVPSNMKLAGAGSSSANDLTGHTLAVMDHANVALKDQGKLEVNATDAIWNGAMTGAAAITSGMNSNFKNTLAGAVALAEDDRAVVAKIQDAKLQGVNQLANTASKSGMDIAAGLALGIEKSGATASGSGLGAGASASLTTTNTRVEAVIQDSDIDANKAKIYNTAMDRDLQIAGGINFGKFGGTLAAGAAVSMLDVNNRIQAKISGGTMNNVGLLDNRAVSDLIQIGAGVSIGIVKGQSTLGVEGTYVENEISNAVNASVEDGAVIVADDVVIRAYDADLDNELGFNQFRKIARDRGYDVDGEGVFEDVNADGGEVQVNKDKVGQEGVLREEVYSNKAMTADANRGNFIITGALGLAMNSSTQGTLTAGAAIANSKINNDFRTGIKDSQITTKSSDGLFMKADSDTMIVNVSAGAAAAKATSGGLTAAGSVGMIETNNDTISKVANSSITGKKADITAVTKSNAINVAGQLGPSKSSLAAGASVILNDLNNHTGAYVYGSDLKNELVKVGAINESKNLAISAGAMLAMANQGVALNGCVAINKGANSTEAIVDEYVAADGSRRRASIRDAKTIDVTTWDNTDTKTIAGGLTLGSTNISLGGSVAQTNIGEEDGRQANRAALSHTDIIGEQNTKVNVKAEDTALMWTIAAGLAAGKGQGGAAAGSVAIANLYKNTEASMVGTDMTAADGAENTGVVNVKADSMSDVITSGDGAALTTSLAAGGAGVGLTTTYMDTKAIIDGGNYDQVKHVLVDADSQSEFMNIGIGAAVAGGSGGSLAGNVAIIEMGNATSAMLKNAVVDAQGNVGVTADSYEHMENYGGALAVTPGAGYLAGGVSLAINDIKGNTSALVENSQINAEGNAQESITVGGSTLRGLVVDADAEHEVDNIIMSGGVAASGNAGFGLAGTIVFNNVSGATEAKLLSSDINEADRAGDVSVRANDYMDISSHTGALDVGIGANVGGGLGEAAESNKLERKTKAQIIGAAEKSNVNAKLLNVQAKGNQKILSTASGASFAGGAYGAIGVAGSLSLVNNSTETIAGVENVNSVNDGVTVDAHNHKEVAFHGNSVALTGAIGSISAGAGVAIINDASLTKADLNSSTIKHRDGNAKDRVKALSDGTFKSQLGNVSVGISIGAGMSGVVSINDHTNKVQANVNETEIGTYDKEAQQVEIVAENKIDNKYTNIAGAGGSLIAAAAGVMLNDIHSAAEVNFNNSSVYGQDLKVDAKESRTTDQLAVSAALGTLGVPVNVEITNIGDDLETEYGRIKAKTHSEREGDEAWGDVGQKVDISQALDVADKSVQLQNTLLKSEFTGGVYGTKDTDMVNDIYQIDLYKGSDVTHLSNGMKGALHQREVGDVNGVHVNMANSEAYVDNANIKAHADTVAEVNDVRGVLSGASMSSNVGILKVKRNNTVNLGNTDIVAGNIDIMTSQGGTSEINAYQGTLSGGGLNVTYGEAKFDGLNDINLSQVDLHASDRLHIATEDKARAKVQATSVDVVLGAAGAVIAKAENKGSSEIIIDGGSSFSAGNDMKIIASHGVGREDLQAAQNLYDQILTKAWSEGGELYELEKLYKESEKKYNGTDDVQKKAMYYSMMENYRIESEKKLVEISEMAERTRMEHLLDKKDAATLSIELTPISAGIISGLGVHGTASDQVKTGVYVYDSGNSFRSGGELELLSLNNTVNDVVSDPVVAGIANLGLTGTGVESQLHSTLDISDDNSFEAQNINLGAQSYAANRVDALTVGASILGSFTVNWSDADANNEINVKVGENAFEGNLNIKGQSEVDQLNYIDGVNVGILVATGTNKSNTNTINNVFVKADGMKAGSNVNKLNIQALGKTGQLVDCAGYGGGAVDVSPAAAMIYSDIGSEDKTNKAEVKLVGNWEAREMDVKAQQDTYLNLWADAVRGCIAGVSGVYNYNDVWNDTRVILDGAQIETGESLDILSRNNINYDNRTWGAGYGGLANSGIFAYDDIIFNNNVDIINGSDIASQGNINIQAITGDMSGTAQTPLANISKDVVVKSAGLEAGTYSKSDNEYVINNIIKLAKDSSLSTVGPAKSNPHDNDISLTAAERIKIVESNKSNTQGGLLGGSIGKSNIKIDQQNKIIIEGDVSSNYDAYLDAGDSNRIEMVLKTNSFNRCIIPVATVPNMDRDVNQHNLIELTADGNIDTVRNLRMAATAGNTNMKAEVDETRIWGGKQKKTSGASTLDGTGHHIGDLNNEIKVEGNVHAGIHNTLDMNIDYLDDNAKKKFLEVLDAYVDNTIGLTELNEKLIAAGKDYNDKLDEMIPVREELAKKKAEYESNLSMKNTLGREHGRLKARLEKIDKELVGAQSELEAAKKTANSTWDSNVDIRITNGEQHLVGEKVTKDNYQDLAKQDYLATDKATEELWNGFDDNAKYEYYKKYYDVDKALDAYVSASVIEEQRAVDIKMDEHADFETRINNKYNEYDKIYSQTELDAQKKVVDDLQQQLDNFKKTDEVVALKAAYDSAQENYMIAWNEGMSPQVISNYLFGTDGSGMKDYFKITLSEESQWFNKVYGENAIRAAIIDYAVHLTDNLKALNTMMKEYGHSNAGTEYREKIQSIQAELVSLGLGYTDGSGGFIVSEGGSIVPAIIIPDLVVSGGNVLMSGNKVHGKGTIHAEGSPYVDITNASDFYLQVHDIKIDSAGGNVRLNDKDFDYTDSTINVISNPTELIGGTDAYIKLKATTNTKASEGRFTPDIGVFGQLYNPFGKVEIHNVNNGVYIVGDEGGKVRLDGSFDSGSGAVKARDVSITAGTSVTQGYQDDIVNVGGSPHFSVPEETVRCIQEAFINRLGAKLENDGSFYTAFETVEDLASFIEKYAYKDKDKKNRFNAEESLDIAQGLTGQISEYEDVDGSKKHRQSGIYAAGSIYINAADINVNGTMQSGYDKYKLNVDSYAVDQLREYGIVPDGVEYENGKGYLVTTDNGAYYDTNTGKFNYGMKGWYDPAEDAIITEAVNQAGAGQIILKGSVANTGSGKLIVLDGGAAFDIYGGSDCKLVVNGINGETVNGRIEIYDKNYGYGTNSDNHYITNSKKTVFTDDGTYHPESGMMYKWTSGDSSRVITHYKHYYESSWWGLAEDEFNSTISKRDESDMRDGNPITQKGEQGTRKDIIGDRSHDGEYVELKDLSNDDSSWDSVYIINAERTAKKMQARDKDGNLLFCVDKNNDGIRDRDSAGNEIRTTDDSSGLPSWQREKDGSYRYELYRSPREVTIRSKGLFGLWGKEITTKWYTTKGMLTSYNFSLKADNPIEVKFIGKDSGSSINIDNLGDVLINDDLRADKVSVSSRYGNITADKFGSLLDGALIYADNLSFDAGGNVQLAQRSNEAPLELSGYAGGNIEVNAYAGNTTGDVMLENLSALGSVVLNTEGSIYNQPYAGSGFGTGLSGKGITINAAGNVGAAHDRLRVNSVDDVRIDVMAQDDIYLYNEDMDVYYDKGRDIMGRNYSDKSNDRYDPMSLGEIVSLNGNVDLLSYDGFVDGIKDNAKESFSDVEKLADWKRLGLLGNDGVAEELKNDKETQINTLITGARAVAAEFDFVSAGQQLTADVSDEYNGYYEAMMTMQDKQLAVNRAFKAMAQDNSESNKAIHEAAVKEYNEAFGIYTQKENIYKDAKRAWLDAYMPTTGIPDDRYDRRNKMSNLLYNYEILTQMAPGQEDNYGWTERQLLYAVKDSIINPDAGVITDVKTPNITANNIKLVAQNGDLGTIDKNTTRIKIAEMFDESNTAIEADLKKLSQAHADDVVWTEDEFIINNSVPISTKLHNGKGRLEIAAPDSEHILIISKDAQMNIDQIISGGEVRLLSQNGIQAIDRAGAGIIVGSKITLEGGLGDIGSSVNNIQIGLLDNGKLNANTSKDLYLEQLNSVDADLGGRRLNRDFVLGSLAGENIVLANKNTITSGGNVIVRNIISGNDSQSGGKEENISYINASKSLVINTEGNVGEQNSGLRVKNSGATVEIYGADNVYLNARKGGALVLKDIQTDGELNLLGEGSVLVGQVDNPKTTEDEGVAAVVDADKISIITDYDISFTGDITHRDDYNPMILGSMVGSITQNAVADDGVGIHANSLMLSAIQGKVDLQDADNNISNLRVTSLGKDLLFKTAADNLNIGFTYVHNHYGGNVALENLTGSITTDRGSKAYIKGNVDLKAKNNIINTAEWYADEDINMTAGDLVEANGILEAGQDITAQADNVALRKDVRAENDILVKATYSAELNGKLFAGNDLVAESGSTAVVRDNIRAGHDVKLKGRYLDADAVVKAKNDIALQAEKTAKVNNTYEAGHDLRVKANNLKVDAMLKAQNNAQLQALGTLNQKGMLLVDKVANVEAANADIQGKVAGTAGVSLDVAEALKLQGRVEANLGEADLAAQNIEITNMADVYGKEGVSLQAAETLSLAGDVNSQGNVAAEAKTTNLTGNVKAVGDIALRNADSAYLNGYVVAQGDLLVTADGQETSMGDLNLVGIVRAEKDLRALASNNILVKNKVTAGNDVTLQAGNDALLHAAVEADNNARVVAGHDLLQKANLSAGRGNAALKAVNNVIMDASVQAAGNVEALAAKGLAMVNDNVKAGQNIQIGAGQMVKVAAGIDAEAGAVALQARNVAVDAGVNVGTDLLIKAEQAINTKKALVAARDLTLVAEGAVNLAGDLNAGRDLYLGADNLTVNYDLGVGRDLILLAAQDAALENDVQVAGDVKLAAGNDLRLNRAVKAGRSLQALAGRNLAARDYVTAGENVQLNAGGNANLSGSFEATNMYVGAKNVNISGDYTLSGDLELVAAGSAMLTGYGDAGNNLNIKAQNATISGDALVANNVNALGANTVKLTGYVDAGNDVLAVTGGNNEPRLSGDVYAGGKLTNRKNDVAAGAEVEAAATAQAEQVAAGLVELEEALSNNGTLRAQSVLGSVAGSLNEFLGLAPDTAVDLDLLEVMAMGGQVGDNKVDLQSVNGSYVALVGAPAAENEISVAKLVGFLQEQGLLAEDNLLARLAQADYSSYSTKMIVASMYQDAPQTDEAQSYEV